MIKRGCSGMVCEVNELFGNMDSPSFSSNLGNSRDFGVFITAFLLIKTYWRLRSQST